MGPWAFLGWVVGLAAVVYFSMMETQERTEKHYLHVQEVMERVRTAQKDIHVEPLNLSFVDDLKAKHGKWRDEWKTLLSLEATNQQDIATHWAETKRTMLESVSAKQDEIDRVRESEREILAQLGEWRAVRASIQATATAIEALKRQIAVRQTQNAQMRDDAIARGKARRQKQIDHDEYVQMMRAEAAAVADAADQRRRFLSTAAVAGAIVAFGAVMIALDRMTRRQPKAKAA
ncbi:Aste57867_22041 [Aphanomyces stellatus]|uniref:Aste57867_22041 protein n=1 Tax=Aphanomyces stellatus TaxID=120398 RepID=A0A485LP32_9STRA|nr:hypothetical protein As57867_021972 [Aphanomyces stellatus]VFT98709.1 Aste57867_22041 [Aphanomyces stellatus]